jgi:predicted dehydrogenase
MPALVEVTGVRLAAVCDVWDQHLAEARKVAGAEALATKRYREVLDRKDIDAVLIATPDHLHVPITVEACAAGKDVYVEKPLTHEPSEGERVIAAQNDHRRIVQVGTQQRSMPQYQKALEIIQSGGIGPIHKAHITWNRNAALTNSRPSYGIDPKSVDWEAFLGPVREQPFDEFRFRNWRWFWDFGGGIFTDLMVHQIDIVNLLLGLEHAATAASIGDHFQTRGLWETPDAVQTLLRYPEKGLQVYFEGTFANARNGAMIELMGSEATLYLDRSRLEVHPEPGRSKKHDDLILDAGKRGADFSGVNGELLHLTNWVECIRSRKPPRSPAESGVSAAGAAHLANRALRSGQIAQWA